VPQVGPIVTAEGVVKRWGATTALDGADFAIGPGVTGLLGANGAGKTTLFGLFLGLHRPDEGTVRVLGLDPATAGPAVRERIGYAPEHDALPGDTRAHDLVRHLAEVHGLPRREAVGRASDALWQVGLGEERYRAVGTMSTGQRQRVKLAAALGHDPALLLLDEPTNGLDPVQRDQMLALVRRIGTEFGIHVVISSHLLEEVERVADAAVILAEGRVVASGTLDELRAGGTGGLVVETDTPDAAAGLAAILAERGLAAQRDGFRLVVPGDAGAAADAVRDAAVAAGAGLRRLAPRTTSLEEVFLAAGASAPVAPTTSGEHAGG
jgi:ABC-2 type transport system ATP-binding protein